VHAILQILPFTVSNMKLHAIAFFALNVITG